MSLKFLLSDIRGSFLNMGFVFGFCGISALPAYHFVTDSFRSGDPCFAVVNILAASGFAVFLPVFPVLGYASGFCGECESGYYRLIPARMEPQKYAILAGLREEGKTIIPASHNNEDIEILCDEVYEMDQGKLIIGKV